MSNQKDEVVELPKQEKDVIDITHFSDSDDDQSISNSGKRSNTNDPRTPLPIVIKEEPGLYHTPTTPISEIRIKEEPAVFSEVEVEQPDEPVEVQKPENPFEYQKPVANQKPEHPFDYQIPPTNPDTQKGNHPLDPIGSDEEYLRERENEEWMNRLTRSAKKREKDTKNRRNKMKLSEYTRECFYRCEYKQFEVSMQI